MIRYLGTLIAVAIVAAPAAALAGDSSCVWRALPETVRTSTLRQFAAGGPDAMFEGVADEVLGEATLKCVALPKSPRDQERVAEAVGVALGGYVIQIGSEQALVSKLHVESSALERAYGTLTPKLRKDLVNAMMSDKDPADSIIRALVSAIQTAYPDGDLEKLSSSPEFVQFFYYFGGRALREQNEAKF